LREIDPILIANSYDQVNFDGIGSFRNLNIGRNIELAPFQVILVDQGKAHMK